MSRFLPHIEFWPLWAALLKMSVILPHPKFSSILGRPWFFSAVRSTFLAEEEAQSVEILPPPNILAFFGPPRPLKDVWFYPILNFGKFGAPSLVTHLTFQHVINPNHPQTPPQHPPTPSTPRPNTPPEHPEHPEHPKHPKHPKHLNGH